MSVPRNYVDCEVRVLLNEGQYEGLKARLFGDATLLGEDWEETRYYEGPHDLRIQKTGSRARLLLRQPKAIGSAQERIEIPVAGHQFDDLANFLDALGYKVGIVWHRHRMTFAWGGMSASLDYTKGYGHVLEIKKSVLQEERERVNRELHELLDLLNLRATPKPVLHDRFTWYRMRWRELLAAEAQATAPAAEAAPAARAKEEEMATAS